jgi:hypothetical protein
MAFGAGAFISAGAYQLIIGGVVKEKWSFALVGLGIADGALTVNFADRRVNKLRGADRFDFDGDQAGGSGPGKLNGSLLDGVHEFLALGLSLVHSITVSPVFLFIIEINNYHQGLCVTII